MDQLPITAEPPASPSTEPRKPRSPAPLSAEDRRRAAQAKYDAALAALNDVEAADRDLEAERAEKERRARIEADAAAALVEKERQAQIAALRDKHAAIVAKLADPAPELAARTARVTDLFLEAFGAVAETNRWLAGRAELVREAGILQSQAEYLGAQFARPPHGAPSDTHARQLIRHGLEKRLPALHMDIESFCYWLRDRW